MEPVPDNDAALRFLRQWASDGPWWVLTAVAVDRKGIQTISFSPEQGDLVLRWLETVNGKRNVYFHVNPTRDRLSKKAERQDVESLAWLHVDVDPRKGEDLQREQDRAYALLQEPPGNVPPPTCVIFSGGGYQGFWRLQDPLPIGGDLAKAEDAKRYNLQLEVTFGADHCHNIDRIMRLPGTINIPDAKKRRAGRVETLAELVEFHDDRVYPLSRFAQAPRVQDEQLDGIGDAPSVEVSGNVERLADIDDLDELCRGTVSEEMKATIVQGSHPVEADRYPSRSEALFAVCCSLARAGASDQLIYSVITDPSFGISASVLDKGSRAHSYALRQIQQAREEAVDPWLRRLNRRHAVISNLGGQCRVMEELSNALGRTDLTFQSFTSFRERYMNQLIQVGVDSKKKKVYEQVGKWWLQHEMRQQYDTVVFAPGVEMRGSYNLWKGYACEARPGDCSLYLDHVRDNICGGDARLYDYLIGWMARAVQRPATPGQVAVVLRGERGIGKGEFVRHFGHLWGRHYLQIGDAKHLVGNFNAHLRDVVLLFADEAFWAGDKKNEGVLKKLITEETLAVEAKGVDVVQQPNYLHLIMASNERWVVPAGRHERRFFVLDVGKDRMRDGAYFSAIDEQMRAGGYEALLHELLTRDLSDYQVREVPHTAALLDQQLLTMSSEEEWWYDKLLHGQVISGVDWRRPVRKDEVLDGYLTYAQRVGSRRSHATALGKFLRHACPTGPRSYQQVVHVNDYTEDRVKITRPYFYEFPDLARCRAHWDQLRGVTHRWPEVGLVGGDEDDNNEGEEPF